MLTDGLVKCYDRIMDIIAWFFLIVCMGIGAFIGYHFGGENYIILGVIFGLVGGFLLESLIFTPLIILNKIYDLLSKNSSEINAWKKSIDSVASNSINNDMDKVQ
jgi:hypothetical protein